ncbi:MAG: ATP phosphoribosyltransferase [Christensenellales bacterium]
MITVALPKGRLSEQTLNILQECGISTNIDFESRKLEFTDLSGEYKFIFVKPSDVPTYVEYGVADLGVCGKDTLLEAGKNVYELLDLGLGKCRICVAGFPDSVPKGNLKVATKYTNIARNYYAAKGENVEIIELHGSIELAPITGLSDVILDIVESGKTLKENNLVVLEEVCKVSARIIANKVSLKLNSALIRDLIEKIGEVQRSKNVNQKF